jgi:hypothetical protein
MTIFVPEPIARMSSDVLKKDPNYVSELERQLNQVSILMNLHFGQKYSGANPRTT